MWNRSYKRGKEHGQRRLRATEVKRKRTRGAWRRPKACGRRTSRQSSRSSRRRMSEIVKRGRACRRACKGERLTRRRCPTCWGAREKASAAVRRGEGYGICWKGVSVPWSAKAWGRRGLEGCAVREEVEEDDGLRLEGDGASGRVEDGGRRRAEKGRVSGCTEDSERRCEEEWACWGAWRRGTVRGRRRRKAP
jgi:hypothetical protein